MRRIASYVSLVTVVVFVYVCLIPSISHAQIGSPIPYPPMRYNVETVKTISGTVKEIRTGVTGSGYAPVIVIVETVEKQRYKVSLGPVWYFIKQGFGIKEGDKVEVTGSDISVVGSNELLAAKVVKGDSILELRDSNGIPYWARSGER